MQIRDVSGDSSKLNYTTGRAEFRWVIWVEPSFLPVKMVENKPPLTAEGFLGIPSREAAAFR